MVGKTNFELSMVIREAHGSHPSFYLGFFFFSEIAEVTKMFNLAPGTDLLEWFWGTLCVPSPVLIHHSFLSGYWPIVSDNQVLGFLPLLRTGNFHTLENHPLLFMKLTQAGFVTNIDRSSVDPHRLYADALLSEGLQHLLKLRPEARAWCLPIPSNYPAPSLGPGNLVPPLSATGIKPLSDRAPWTVHPTLLVSGLAVAHGCASDSEAVASTGPLFDAAAAAASALAGQVTDGPPSIGSPSPARVLSTSLATLSDDSKQRTVITGLFAPLFLTGSSNPAIAPETVDREILRSTVTSLSVLPSLGSRLVYNGFLLEELCGSTEQSAVYKPLLVAPPRHRPKLASPATTPSTLGLPTGSGSPALSAINFGSPLHRAVPLAPINFPRPGPRSPSATKIVPPEASNAAVAMSANATEPTPQQGALSFDQFVVMLSRLYQPSTATPSTPVQQPSRLPIVEDVTLPVAPQTPLDSSSLFPVTPSLSMSSTLLRPATPFASFEAVSTPVFPPPVLISTTRAPQQVEVAEMPVSGDTFSIGDQHYSLMALAKALARAYQYTVVRRPSVPEPPPATPPATAPPPPFEAEDLALMAPLPPAALPAGMPKSTVVAPLRPMVAFVDHPASLPPAASAPAAASGAQTAIPPQPSHSVEPSPSSSVGIDILDLVTRSLAVGTPTKPIPVPAPAPSPSPSPTPDFLVHQSAPPTLPPLDAAPDVQRGPRGGLPPRNGSRPRYPYGSTPPDTASPLANSPSRRHFHQPHHPYGGHGAGGGFGTSGDPREDAHLSNLRTMPFIGNQPNPSSDDMEDPLTGGRPYSRNRYDGRRSTPTGGRKSREARFYERDCETFDLTPASAAFDGTGGLHPAHPGGAAVSAEMEDWARQTQENHARLRADRPSNLIPVPKGAAVAQAPALSTIKPPQFRAKTVEDDDPDRPRQAMVEVAITKGLKFSLDQAVNEFSSFLQAQKEGGGGEGKLIALLKNLCFFAASARHVFVESLLDCFKYQDRKIITYSHYLIDVSRFSCPPGIRDRVLSTMERIVKAESLAGVRKAYALRTYGLYVSPDTAAEPGSLWDLMDPLLDPSVRPEDRATVDAFVTGERAVMQARLPGPPSPSPPLDPSPIVTATCRRPNAPRRLPPWRCCCRRVLSRAAPTWRRGPDRLGPDGFKRFFQGVLKGLGPVPHGAAHALQLFQGALCPDTAKVISRVVCSFCQAAYVVAAPSGPPAPALGPGTKASPLPVPPSPLAAVHPIVRVRLAGLIADTAALLARMARHGKSGGIEGGGEEDGAVSPNTGTELAATSANLCCLLAAMGADLVLANPQAEAPKKEKAPLAPPAQVAPCLPMSSPTESPLALAPALAAIRAFCQLPTWPSGATLRVPLMGRLLGSLLELPPEAAGQPVSNPGDAAPSTALQAAPATSAAAPASAGAADQAGSQTGPAEGEAGANDSPPPSPRATEAGPEGADPMPPTILGAAAGGLSSSATAAASVALLYARFHFSSFHKIALPVRNLDRPFLPDGMYLLQPLGPGSSSLGSRATQLLQPLFPPLSRYLRDRLPALRTQAALGAVWLLHMGPAPAPLAPAQLGLPAPPVGPLAASERDRRPLVCCGPATLGRLVEAELRAERSIQWSLFLEAIRQRLAVSGQAVLPLFWSALRHICAPAAMGPALFVDAACSTTLGDILTDVAAYGPTGRRAVLQFLVELYDAPGASERLTEAVVTTLGIRGAALCEGDPAARDSLVARLVEGANVGSWQLRMLCTQALGTVMLATAEPEAQRIIGSHLAALCAADAASGPLVERPLQLLRLVTAQRRAFQANVLAQFPSPEGLVAGQLELIARAHMTLVQTLAAYAPPLAGALPLGPECRPFLDRFAAVLPEHPFLGDPLWTGTCRPAPPAPAAATPPAAPPSPRPPPPAAAAAAAPTTEPPPAATATASPPPLAPAVVVATVPTAPAPALPTASTNPFDEVPQEAAPAPAPAAPAPAPAAPTSTSLFGPAAAPAAPALSLFGPAQAETVGNNPFDEAPPADHPAAAPAPVPAPAPPQHQEQPQPNESPADAGFFGTAGPAATPGALSLFAAQPATGAPHQEYAAPLSGGATTSLFGPEAPASPSPSPLPAGGHNDLFGAAPSPPPPAGSDLFGSGSVGPSNDLFAASAHSDSLFGPPAAAGGSLFDAAPEAPAAASGRSGSIFEEAAAPAPAPADSGSLFFGGRHSLFDEASATQAHPSAMATLGLPSAPPPPAGAEVPDPEFDPGATRASPMPMPMPAHPGPPDQQPSAQGQGGMLTLFGGMSPMAPASPSPSALPGTVRLEPQGNGRQHPKSFRVASPKEKTVDSSPRVSLPPSGKKARDRMLSPSPADFPLEFVFHHSCDGRDTNVLILLHGLGDTPAPFANLALRMRLPQTCSLSLKGPVPVPLFPEGGAWTVAFESNGELITPTASDTRRLRSLTFSIGKLHDVFRILTTRFGFSPDRIFMLGFSNGALAAVEAARTWPHPLGGVVAISDTVLEECLLTGQPPAPGTPPPGAQTPVLVIHGTRDTTVPVELCRRKAAFLKKPGGMTAVALHEFAKGHEMIKSRAEVDLLMGFFAKRLVLRSGLEGRADLVEVTGQHPLKEALTTRSRQGRTTPPGSEMSAARHRLGLSSKTFA
ncbi:putative phospholipase carboxylesterase [Paratrimastix pyriformis]|uniref:Phospholipase carboxylesterase n=1 Tax=Paratrimastix pyriformis TaxID=342808 RepID=A0ABQ8ULL1_9EUKA|nr:putative phospholipase carboxylesterase [Paratrimastix pyriformis]